MLTRDEALSLILQKTEDTMKNFGFSAVTPAGAQKGDLPVFEDGEHTYMDFTGEKGKLRIEIFGTQALLFAGDAKEGDAADEDLTKISTSYFDLENFDERDIRSLCNEFNESIETRFSSKKAAKNKNTKMPTPVSRAAAKSGSQSYDANTLANRLAGMYPQLKEPYHANFEKYGEFLGEEFFTEYGTSCVIDTIRRAQKQECTKLFRILNDIYENGSNDTQSLIAVTILGEMKNDPALCETAKEYMCDDMREPVLLVNKYLASSAGKKAIKKLKNPPPFKPKKQKKPGMFAQMMAGSGGQGMPPM